MSESNENKSSNAEQEIPADPEDQKSSLKRNSDELPPSPKRTKTDDKQPLDLAVMFGLKEGDRLEVEWEIDHEDGKKEVHWWGATLLKHDGRTEDTVAIRQVFFFAR